MNNKITDRPFEQEIQFRTSRSSGPGGQHVNKTESRVELLFDIEASSFLSRDEKHMLFMRLGNKINREGLLFFAVDEHRSQYKNKELAFQRFYQMVQDALKSRKKRISTRPTRASRLKRMEKKRFQSEKKTQRNRNSWY